MFHHLSSLRKFRLSVRNVLKALSTTQNKTNPWCTTLNNAKQSKPVVYHLPLQTFIGVDLYSLPPTCLSLLDPALPGLPFEQCTDKTSQQPNSKSCKCHLTSLFLSLVNTFQPSFNFSPYWRLTPDLWPFSPLSSSIAAPCFCRSRSGSSSYTLNLNVTESKGLASKRLLSSLYMFSLGNVIHCPALNYHCLYANNSLDVVQPRVYSIASDHIPSCLFDLLLLWPVGQKCSSTYVSLWMED